MPLTAHDSISSPSSLPSSITSRSAPLYLIFHSSPWSPVTSTWCPDCRNARPAFTDSFEGEDKPEAWAMSTDFGPWRANKGEKGKQHPWREERGAGGWGVWSVPTIIRWEGVSSAIRRDDGVETRLD